MFEIMTSSSVEKWNNQRCFVGDEYSGVKQSCLNWSLEVRQGSRERTLVWAGFVSSTFRFGSGVCVLAFVLPSPNDNDKRY